MNIKEAITEIEKRYKAGDKIPCLVHTKDVLTFSGVDSISEIRVTSEYIIILVTSTYYRISEKGKWSEPIREEKNLWNFFKSIEGEYPDVLKRYLKNLDVNFVTNFAAGQRSTLISIAFHWIATKEGKNYWSNINDLYVNYLEN